jgi:hypothetical protein
MSFARHFPEELNMNHFSSDADIEFIGHGLLDRSLPKSKWTHAAHFAAAFWVLRHPGLNAMRDMPGLIRSYNEVTGTPNTDTGGYHETITLASLRAATAWLACREEVPLYAALNELLASEYGKPEWLLAYWSAPLLFSVHARRAWIEPDLKSLPF